MKIQISRREFHTILAALRNYQATYPEADRANDPLPTNDFEEIPLTDDEIDTLCERINTED